MIDSRINSTEYEDFAKGLFKAFLDTKHRNSEGNYELYKGLNNLEKSIRKQIKRKGKNISLWFRFFKGDTLATDINNIKKHTTLSTTTATNYAHMLECMEIAILPDSGLEIHFS